MALVTRVPRDAHDRGVRAEPAGLAFEELTACYSSPLRAYHNLKHIQRCLALFDIVRSGAKHPDEIEFAIWFHDCVYEPGHSDNEQRSAAVAKDFGQRLRATPEFLRRVEHLILATRHAQPPGTPDVALLMDIDMAILAAPAGEYDAYAVAVRQEFDQFPASQYRAGRIQFIRGLLAKPAIFHTAVLGDNTESVARANLAREMQHLEVVD